jgi:methyltransferase (TIGR00027 family)
MQPAIRNICDTARWVAFFRALETRRPDALFRDPYAERLAGERGLQIAGALVDGSKHQWAWVSRTYLFDTFLSREIQNGAEVVLNLAAGLDARPYRMDLSPSLEWVEVDLPEIISHKQSILDGEVPRCKLTQYGLDLANVEQRRSLFAEWDSRGKKVVVASEGLLIYLTDAEVGALATDLSATTNFRSWIVDLASPGQLKLMQRTTGKQLSEAGAPFKFAPAAGANFFVEYGWKPQAVEGLLKTAARFNRHPAELESLLPEPKGVPGNYPWTGVCLLERASGPSR